MINSTYSNIKLNNNYYIQLYQDFLVKTKNEKVVTKKRNGVILYYYFFSIVMCYYELWHCAILFISDQELVFCIDEEISCSLEIAVCT